MRGLALAQTLRRRVFPFLQWLPAVASDTFRPDLEAGLIGAVLILPQAIALATLAGMPPQYGIYTSIFPVIIAALWGSSRHALSGPNTAVCVMIAASVAPFAAVGDEYYVGYVFALTLMVGAIQLALGVFKLGAVLDFISHTVISAIILAVALVMIVSAGSSFLGVMANPGESFFIRLYQMIQDIPRANPFAVIVGFSTIVAGVVARRFWRRYWLIVAVVTGSLVAYLANSLYGSATTNVELLGWLTISLWPASQPIFDLDSMFVLKELVTSAFAIAFLGLMQSVVIARGLAVKSGQHIDTNQEVIGQGLANVAAPFLSSFAGSGSFNRSAANFEAGARTPMAGIYASLFLGTLVYAGASLIAFIPAAAVAALLLLVGYGLIDVGEVRRLMRSGHEAGIFLLTFFAAIAFGLNAGVFVGLLTSLGVYLWYASKPNIVVQEHPARDGRSVTVLTIDGGLFFGSARHVEHILAQLGERGGGQGILLVRTDHLTYIDVPGAGLLARHAKRRRDAGGDMYLYITRESVLETLEKSGLRDVFDSAHIIHRNRDHPMKDMLYPARGGGARRRPQREGVESIPLSALARRLRATRLFSCLSDSQIQRLIEEVEVHTCTAEEVIVSPAKTMTDHLVLLEGELEIQRIWTEPDGTERSYIRTLVPSDANGGIGMLTATSRVSVRALTACQYVLFDADEIDEMLGWEQQLAEIEIDDPQLKHRMGLVKKVGIFRRLPLANVTAAFERMTEQSVEAGEIVIQQGDEGDCYYLIESGEAGVWKLDELSEQIVHAEDTEPIARLGPGDGFGEEALIRGGYRNATVKMITPGRLLILQKHDFDELVRPVIVDEVAPAEALELVTQGRAEWIDCRYDMEFEASRLPRARLMPLDGLREDVHTLDPKQTYILYSGGDRRSRAAVYLLHERNIHSMSLIGGIREWPYEVDASPTAVGNSAVPADFQKKASA